MSWTLIQVRKFSIFGGNWKEWIQKLWPKRILSNFKRLLIYLFWLFCTEWVMFTRNVISTPKNWKAVSSDICVTRYISGRKRNSSTDQKSEQFTDPCRIICLFGGILTSTAFLSACKLAFLEFYTYTQIHTFIYLFIYVEDIKSAIFLNISVGDKTYSATFL